MVVCVPLQPVVHIGVLFLNLLEKTLQMNYRKFYTENKQLHAARVFVKCNDGAEKITKVDVRK